MMEIFGAKDRLMKKIWMIILLGVTLLLIPAIPAAAEEEGDAVPVAGDGVLSEEGEEEIRTGWVRVEDAWYYYDAEGKPLTGLNTIGLHLYFFSGTGEMQTGWIQTPDNRYYFEETGRAKKFGWLEDQGNWYFFTGSVMQTGWLDRNGVWYYLGDDGCMQTGWQKVGTGWYYFAENGRMQTGWKKVDGYWYYFTESGRMKTGWLKDKEKWYYFSANSGRMLTGWIESGDDWYFAEAGGACCMDVLKKIRGIYYYFDPDCRMCSLEGQKAAGVAAGLDGDLSKAFEIAGNISYYGKNLFDKDWTAKALSDFAVDNNKGNCFVYAAYFYAMAKAMGYDAHRVAGYVMVTSGKARHCWTEIDIDGVTYVCDPAAKKVFGTEGSYMFHYGKKGTYMYVEFERLD